MSKWPRAPRQISRGHLVKHMGKFDFFSVQFFKKFNYSLIFIFVLLPLCKFLLIWGSFLSTLLYSKYLQFNSEVPCPLRSLSWGLATWEWVIDWTGLNWLDSTYRKVASRSTSRLVARPGIFRLFIKGKFDPYVLWPFAFGLWPLNSRPVYCSRLYGMYNDWLLI